MELKQFLTVVWKWLWLIVLATGIAAGASYYVTSQQPKAYAASVKLLVGQSLQNPNANSGDLTTSQDLALTYIQIAKTTPVLQGAIDALGLHMSPAELSGLVNAGPILNTELIELSVVDTDPARAQALANEVAHQLTLQGPASNQQDQAKRRDFAQKQADDLQKKIEEAQTTIADLQNSIRVTASAREIADKQQQINTLDAQILQWQQGYTSLLAFLAPTSPNYLSVIEPASLPDSPIAPDPLKNAIVAASIGLMLAVGGALLLEYLDDTVTSPDDVARLLRLPTLGSIGKITGAGDHKLITAQAPRSAITEAYRVMRTDIQFGNGEKPVKSILVTSPGPHEGKSLTAANLAAVMAQGGLRTILVDADLRNPVQHQLFGMSNDVGLTNGLVAKGTLDGLARPTEIGNLRLITSGALLPNPAEALGSEGMRKLKAELEADADMVIFDSPPCFPLADTPILARLAESVILVLDAGHTRRGMALRAKELLEKVGAHNLSTVLNRSRSRVGD